MTILYKLTNSLGNTRGDMHWIPGLANTLKAKLHPKLCTSDVIHCYEDAKLSFFIDPIHSNFGKEARLFECKGEIVVRDNQIKCGVFSLFCVKELLHLPKPTLNQRIYFAILCGQEVFKNKAWNNWANNWISGKNRTARAAATAYSAAAADAAAYAADAAAYAADAAAYAADAAAYASDAAAYAARAAAYAADAAAYASDAAATAYSAAAADAAAYASDAAYAAAGKLDLIAIAAKAMEF